jgi:NADP-dependent 3-hydroxy acid dehydrogenase YdfG
LSFPMPQSSRSKTFTPCRPKNGSGELNINLSGGFYMAQAAALKLVEQKREGRIVFTGSWARTRAAPHIPAYSSPKPACACCANAWRSIWRRTHSCQRSRARLRQCRP